jgi:hypothetical protein
MTQAQGTATPPTATPPRAGGSASAAQTEGRDKPRGGTARGGGAGPPHPDTKPAETCGRPINAPFLWSGALSTKPRQRWRGVEGIKPSDLDLFP